MLSDGDDDAALRRPIQLRQDEAGESNSIVEFLGLNQRVQAGGGVENHEPLVSGPRHLPGDDAVDLLQFLHQISLGVESARGVNEKVGCLSGHSGLQRIEDHCGGISASLVTDHMGPDAPTPELKLLDGSGAEGVGPGDDHPATFIDQAFREFPDGGGLA